jgi:hypothetical protein
MALVSLCAPTSLANIPMPASIRIFAALVAFLRNDATQSPYSGRQTF